MGRRVGIAAGLLLVVALGIAVALRVGRQARPEPPPAAASADAPARAASPTAADAGSRPTAASSNPGPGVPALPAAVEPPAAAVAGAEVDSSTAVNLGLAHLGGHVDHVTGSLGPGYLGPCLNDGDLESVWRIREGVLYPIDIDLSFYERRAVLVSAVSVVLPPEAAEAPRGVEVWVLGAQDGGSFNRVTAQSLAPEPREQRIVFSPVEAQRLRLRIVSGRSPDRIGLSEVKVFEGSRPGYTPLAERDPSVAEWKMSPRQAAQLGLDWLGQAAPDWDHTHKCFGCHVQAQVLMGQAIGLKNSYVVDGESFDLLERKIRGYQGRDGGKEDGSWFEGSIPATTFATTAIIAANERRAATEDSNLLGAVNWLLPRQFPQGWFWTDHEGFPIVQGPFQTTSNAAAALFDAHLRTKDEKYKRAAERAMGWIAATDTETTQDRMYKVVALARFGTPEQRRLIRPELEHLAAQQERDGGWKERSTMTGSNAFATGQVLYALKQAGASVHSPVFRRGARYLIETQMRDGRAGMIGPWKAVNTQSMRPTNIDPTMWAAIGLAGTYTSEETGGLELLFTSAKKPATRNVEIILDASGSMKLPLGSSTRWKTALSVLEEVVRELPADFKVALRTYGHRYPSRSRETCSDTELVVRPSPLDRKRLLDVARRLRPRGETPLVRSVLASPDDLKPVGGGTVILITDGEESCQGDLAAAAEKLRASGVELTLNIVGFTLTGKKTGEELGGLASSTGGRFYAAQNGDALARAVILSALQAVPFEVLDESGQVVRGSESSTLGLELKVGKYRVVVHAPGQELSQPVQIEKDKDTVLEVSLEGDRFVLASR